MKFYKLFILSMTFFLPPALEAENTPQGSQYNFDKDIKPLLQRYCYNCQDDDTQKGEVQLDSLDPDIIKGQDGEHWHAALDAINSGDMPPAKKKKQPTDAERRKIVEWITANIKLAGKLNKGKVQSVVRRLTREQYNNSLNDLLGINLNVTNLLPPESPSKMGFLNDGALQYSSSLLLETYQEIARKAVKMAIGPAKKPSVYRYRVDFGKGISKVQNTQKGGYDSVPLSGLDFMPYVLDKNGIALESSAKTETGKKVADVLKSISVGLRGSKKGNRFYSSKKALTLYAGNPQRNKAPESWRPPNPNVKLLIQREFPTTGKFRYTVKAANSLAKKLPSYFIGSTWGRFAKNPSLVSWEKGSLKAALKAIIIPANSFKNLKDVKVVNGVIKVQKTKNNLGQFTLIFNLPKAAFYQIDLVYKKLPENEKQRKIQVYSKHFKQNFTFIFKPGKNKLEIASLLSGRFKKG
ncbi:MAG: DUF1587 domain-containing protein, partial [Lentisphaeraceae bacterium]|nr:DUF1587 domain-containing protein [Lentisphaeraceae bacterium]